MITVGSLCTGIGGTLADVAYADLWGKYAGAIERWAQIMGEDAPHPTDDNGRLNPDFVRWMMGYEPGWVDGISRTGQLKALGNAIVPLQAATAWAHLLGLDVTVTERESLMPTPRTSDTNGPGSHGVGWAGPADRCGTDD